MNWPLLAVLCVFSFFIWYVADLLGYFGTLMVLIVLVLFFAFVPNTLKHNPGLSNLDMVCVCWLLFSVVVFDLMGWNAMLWTLTVAVPLLLIRKGVSIVPKLGLIEGLKRKLAALSGLSLGLSALAVWFRTIWFINDKDRIFIDNVITFTFIVVFPVSIVATMLFETSDKNIKASAENLNLCS